MIVITDGENHEDNAVSAAGNARDKDVTIHVLGVGSSEGAPIPVYANGNQSVFKTDSTGQTVVTKLNEDMCKEIAHAGGGAYVRATNANGGLGIIKSEIDRMQKKHYGSKMFKDFEDRFQVFLGIAFLLLVAEFFISNRKSLRFSNLKLFEVKRT
jgi:Ca-activated chloride channel family protein